MLLLVPIYKYQFIKNNAQKMEFKHLKFLIKLLSSRAVGSLIITVLCGGLLACQKQSELDLTAPSITITSPLPGSDIASNKLITLTGTVSSDATSVTVSQDDNPALDATLVGTDFSIPITLNDGTNKLKATAKDATGNYISVTFYLYFPVLNLVDGDSATLVIGQPDYVSNAANRGTTPTANSLSGVTGSLFQRNHTILYIPDPGNNRILGFNTVPDVLDVGANFVIGQADLTSAVSDITPSRFNAPTGIYTTDTQLFVVDSGNNRVLMWDTVPNNGSTDANRVIGWPDLLTPSSGCSSSTLQNPVSVFVVSDKLVVLDQGNNRVLIWNSIPSTDGVAADVVLGQSGATPMDVCAANDTNGDNVTDGISASTLNNPGGLWTDGTRLMVADTGNNRVLVWDSFPSSNGQAADWVLGQADKNSAALVNPPNDGSDLNGPKSVTSNGNQVIVADSGNYRVLIWNAFPAADKPAADHVIGQANFTDNSPVLGQSTLESADNVFVDRTNLYVMDGNRILKFSNP